jgi:hypothetical protein
MVPLSALQVIYCILEIDVFSGLRHQEVDF